ncbi:Spherulin-4 [Arthrobotrys entomopaga]|nr:Spherulin-4 [Arthrobotrys entomopaga]
MSAYSQSPSPRMPVSPRGSICGHPNRRQSLPRILEGEPFCHVFKRPPGCLPENDSQIYSHPRKNSDFIKSGASPEDIQRRLQEEICKNCSSCSRLRKINYALFISMILLLTTYLSLPISRALLYKRPQSGQIPIPGELSPLISLEARSSSVSTSIILPAYFGPEDTASWNKVFTQIEKYQDSIGFMVIINPDNGPGSTSETSRYASTIKTLSQYNNVNILGYVHQTWGERDIIPDVNTWLKYFPKQLDGFFLDEMPSEATAAALKAVSANNGYVKQKAASNFRQNKQALVVQNPGTEADSGFFSLTYNADVTIVLENTVNYFPVWAAMTPPSRSIATSRLGMILLDINDGAMDKTVRSMVKYAKCLFVSNLGADTAYLTIASDWGVFIETADTYGGAGASAVATKSPTAQTSTATKKGTAAKYTLKTSTKGIKTSSLKKTSTRSALRIFPTPKKNVAQKAKQNPSSSVFGDITSD